MAFSYLTDVVLEDRDSTCTICQRFDSDPSEFSLGDYIVPYGITEGWNEDFERYIAGVTYPSAGELKADIEVPRYCEHLFNYRFDGGRHVAASPVLVTDLAPSSDMTMYYDIVQTPLSWVWNGSVRNGLEWRTFQQHVPRVLMPRFVDCDLVSIQAGTNLDYRIQSFWTTAHYGSTMTSDFFWSNPFEPVYSSVEQYVTDQYQPRGSCWTTYMNVWSNQVSFDDYLYLYDPRMMFTQPRNRPSYSPRTFQAITANNMVSASTWTLVPGSFELLFNNSTSPYTVPIQLQWYRFCKSVTGFMDENTKYGGYGLYQMTPTHPAIYWYCGESAFYTDTHPISLSYNELPPISDLLNLAPLSSMYGNDTCVHTSFSARGILPPMIFEKGNNICIIASTPELLYSNVLKFARKPSVSGITYTVSATHEDEILVLPNLEPVVPNADCDDDTVSMADSVLCLIQTYFESLDIQRKTLKVLSVANVLCTIRDHLVNDSISIPTLATSLLTFLESFELISMLSWPVSVAMAHIKKWLEAWFTPQDFEPNAAPDLMTVLASVLSMIMSTLLGFNLIPKTVLAYFRDANSISRFFTSTKDSLKHIFTSLAVQDSDYIAAQLDRICNEREKFTTTPVQEFLTDRTQYKRMRELTDEYSSLMKSIPLDSHRLYTSYFQRYNSYSSTYNEVLRALEAYHLNDDRVEPVGILLIGSTTTGKSTMSQRLTADISHLMGWPSRPYVCTLNSEGDYNAPIGDEHVMIIEEFLAQMNSKLSSLVLPLFSTVPLQMQGAAIENKNQYARFNVVVGTTNTNPSTMCSMLPYPEQAARDAFMGRFIIVRVEAPGAPSRSEPNPGFWKHDFSHARLTLCKPSIQYVKDFDSGEEVSYHWVLSKLHRLATQHELAYWSKKKGDVPAKLAEYRDERIQYLEKMQVFQLEPSKVAIAPYSSLPVAEVGGAKPLSNVLTSSSPLVTMVAPPLVATASSNDVFMTTSDSEASDTPVAAYNWNAERPALVRDSSSDDVSVGSDNVDLSPTPKRNPGVNSRGVSYLRGRGARGRNQRRVQQVIPNAGQDFFIIRLQGDPGVGKTRFLKTFIQAASVAMKLPYTPLSYDKQRGFYPIIKERSVIVLDDILFPKRYEQWVSYINTIHPSSIVIIATNTQYKRTYHTGSYIDTALILPRLLQSGKAPCSWYVPYSVYPGALRRIGLSGTIQSSSITTCSSDHTFTFQFDTMFNIEHFEEQDGRDVLTRLTTVEAISLITRAYDTFLDRSLELVHVAQPPVVDSYDLSIDARTEADLLVVLQSQVSLLSLWTGSFQNEAVTMTMNTDLIHRAKSIDVSDIVKTFSTTRLIECVPTLVSRLRRVKSDVTAKVQIGDRLILIAGSAMYNGFAMVENVTMTSVGGLVYIKDDAVAFTLAPNQLYLLDLPWNSAMPMDPEIYNILFQYLDANKSALIRNNPYYRRSLSQRLAEESFDLALAKPDVKRALKWVGLAIGVGAALYATKKVYSWMTKPSRNVAFFHNATDSSSAEWSPYQRTFAKQYTRHLNEAKLSAPKGTDFNTYWFDEYLPKYADPEFLRGYADSNVIAKSYFANSELDPDFLRTNMVTPNVLPYTRNAIDRVTPIAPPPADLPWRDAIYENMVIARGIGNAHGLMIYQRYGITVAHLAEKRDFIDIETNSGVHRATIIKRYAGEDLIMFVLPSGPSYKDIRSRFLAEPRYFTGVPGIFLRVDSAGRQAIHGFIQRIPSSSHQGKAISESVSSTVDCYQFSVASGVHTSKYMATGDCGFPLIHQNAVDSKILGIHFVWGTTLSFFAPVFQSHFEIPLVDLQLEKNHAGPAPWEITESTDLEWDDDWDYGIYSTDAKIPTFRRRQKKPLRELFGVDLPIANNYALAPQHVSEVRDTSKLLMNPTTYKLDIGYTQLMKYAIPIVTDIDLTLYNATEETLAQLYTYWYPESRLLNRHQILNGVDETDAMYGYIDGLDMGKSAGPTFAMYGAKSKGDCFDSKIVNQRHIFFNKKGHELNELFQDRFERFDMAITSSTPYFPHARACLKRELLPRAKVDVGGTRVFIVPDLEVVAMGKRLYGYHIGLEKKHHLEAWCQLGMVCSSDFQMKFFPRRLELDTLKLVDATRLDKYIPFCLKSSFAKLIGAKTIVPGRLQHEVQEMFVNYEKSLRNSAVWWQGVPYQFSRGVYSGEVGTTSKDTYAMSFMYIYSMFKYARSHSLPPPCFDDLKDPEKNLVAIFGDDMNFSQHLYRDMTDDDFIKGFSDFGIEITFSHEKPFFLGNELYMMNGFIIPRPMKSTFERLLFWYSPEEDILIQFAIILYSAALYDITYFNCIKDCINLVIPVVYNPDVQRELRVLIQSSKYDDLRLMALTRTYDNRFTYLSDVLVTVRANSFKKLLPLYLGRDGSIVCGTSIDFRTNKNRRNKELSTKLDYKNAPYLRDLLVRDNIEPVVPNMMSAPMQAGPSGSGGKQQAPQPVVDVRDSNVVQGSPRDSVAATIPQGDISVPHDAAGLGPDPTMTSNTISSLQFNTLGVIDPVQYRACDVPESNVDMRTLSELAYQPFTSPNTLLIDSTKTTGTIIGVFPYGPNILVPGAGPTDPQVVQPNPFLNPYAQMWIKAHKYYIGDIAYTISVDGPTFMQGSLKWFWYSTTPAVGSKVDWADAERVNWCEIKIAGHTNQTLVIGDRRQTGYFRATDGSDLETQPTPSLVLAIYHPVANQFQTGEIQTYANVIVRSQLVDQKFGAGRPFYAFTARNPDEVTYLQELKSLYKRRLPRPLKMKPVAQISLPAVLCSDASKVNRSNPRLWLFTDGNADFTLNRSYTPCLPAKLCGAGPSNGMLRSLGMYIADDPHGFGEAGRVCSNMPNYLIPLESNSLYWGPNRERFYNQLRQLALGKSFLSRNLKTHPPPVTDGEARIVGPDGVFIFGWRSWIATEEPQTTDKPLEYIYTDFSSPDELLPTNIIRLVFSEVPPCTVPNVVSVATDVSTTTIVSRFLALAQTLGATTYLQFDLYDRVSAATIGQAMFDVRSLQFLVKADSISGSYYRTAPFDLSTIDFTNFSAQTSLTNLKVFSTTAWDNRFVEAVRPNMMRMAAQYLNPGTVNFMEADMLSMRSLGTSRSSLSGSEFSYRMNPVPGSLRSRSSSTGSIFSESRDPLVPENPAYLPNNPEYRYDPLLSDTTSIATTSSSPSTVSEQMTQASKNIKTEQYASTGIAAGTTIAGAALSAIPVVGPIIGAAVMAGGMVGSAALAADANEKAAKMQSDAVKSSSATQANSANRRTEMLREYVAQSPTARLGSSM